MRKKKFAARASSPSRNRSQLAVSKKSRLKSWLCPKRAAEKPAVSKQKPAAKAGRVQTVYHVHIRKLRLSFFAFLYFAGIFSHLREKASLFFFVIFFGIFCVFCRGRIYNFPELFFLQKNRDSVGLKIRHIKYV